jgi:hypothetical protein
MGHCVPLYLMNSGTQNFFGTTTFETKHISTARTRSYKLSRGDVVWGRRRLLSCLLCEVLCVGKGFNHKIMIKVQESPPSIMVTRNLWSARV